jgi:hypothetical protein
LLARSVDWPALGPWNPTSTDITGLRRVGNRGLNGLVNTLFGTRYSDLCYGYNAFWRRA